MANINNEMEVEDESKKVISANFSFLESMKLIK